MPQTSKSKKPRDENTVYSGRDSFPAKGRRIPIHLQERVETELNKLIDQKHIAKLEKWPENQFIIPIFITVKKIKR